MGEKEERFAVYFIVTIRGPKLANTCPYYWNSNKKEQQIIFSREFVIKIKLKKPYPQKKDHQISDNNESFQC